MALTDNLIAYYKLDSNSNDSVGSNNGTATSVSYVSGKISNGASFNGTSSQVSIPKVVSSYMSLSCWIYPTVTIPVNTGIVTNMGANSSDNGGCRLFASSSGNIVFNILPTATTQVSSGAYTISNNVWTHIVGTYDGSNIVLYINGVAHSTVAHSGTIRNPSASFSFLGNGKSWSGSPNYFYTGTIDEVGIWNRAITATEVATLYNGGTGLSYPFLLGNPAFFLNFL